MLQYLINWILLEKKMKHFDIGSLLVILITFVLFTIALFFTGFTHDLLLEAGVFLVSVKLIIMAYKSSVSKLHIDQELEEIKSLLIELQKKHQDKDR
jgi:glucan phosphoethanolaminetransferase (alkaline phosphatase superfamily)